MNIRVYFVSILTVVAAAIPSLGEAAPAQAANGKSRSQALQTVLQKFDSELRQNSAHRQELFAKLKSAKTPAERAAVLAELKACHQEHAKLTSELKAGLQQVHTTHDGHGK